MQYHKGELHFAKEDQCSSCEYLNRAICCPLVEAVATGIVFLDEGGMFVKNCGFYVKHKRHLEVVPKPEPDPCQGKSSKNSTSSRRRKKRTT